MVNLGFIMILPTKGITPLNIARHRYSKFKIKNTDRILDLGCGDGIGISILKDSGNFNIFGLDISKMSLKVAKKKHPDVKFVLGSAMKLPFKNNSFDIVLVDSVFHHLKDYPTSIREIYRVLVRGGKLCFIEPHESPWRKILDFLTTLSISEFLPFLKNRRPAYLAEKELMEYWLQNEQALLSLLKKQDFKKIFLKIDLLSIIAQYQKI